MSEENKVRKNSAEGRVIDCFRTASGKRVSYDSTMVIIKHDRKTNEFSWWLKMHRESSAEPAIPQYMSKLQEDRK